MPRSREFTATGQFRPRGKLLLTTPGNAASILIFDSKRGHVRFVLKNEGSGVMTRKILVVDDNPDTRDLTHLHLTTEGFVVVVASDGREGLYMAVAEQPDLIITDISMPGIDGVDLVKQLRAQPELDNVPILVLTAFGNDEMDHAIRAGAYRAMSKPVHLDSLMDEVRELLAESERG